MQTCKSTFTISLLPEKQAICNGVVPTLSTSRGFAPFCSRYTFECQGDISKAEEEKFKKREEKEKQMRGKGIRRTQSNLFCKSGEVRSINCHLLYQLVPLVAREDVPHSIPSGQHNSGRWSCIIC